MINEIQKLLEQYLIWLKDKTILRQIDDWVEITTPYLDRHNDYLQIYVKRENGNFILSDDGYIVEDLKRSGCELGSKKRKELLTITLNGFGVKLEGEALVVHASRDNFALKKHNLVQSMLAINDIFYLAAPVIAGLFLEDVTAWLNSSNIRYTPRVKFTGKSGYDYLFDFVIPSSQKQPERILRVINHPNKDAAQAAAFSWIDTKDVRPLNSRAYAFLNDTEQTPSSTVLDALKSYEMNPVLWKDRDKILEELAA